MKRDERIRVQLDFDMAEITFFDLADMTLIHLQRSSWPVSVLLLEPV